MTSPQPASPHAARAVAVSHLIEQVRGITRGQEVTREALDRIAAPLVALGRQRALFPDTHFPLPEGERGALYQLAGDADGSLALYVSVLAPGRSPPLHDHTTWAVIAGVRGEEHNTILRRTTGPDGRARLDPVGEAVAAPGSAVTLLPEEVHTIRLQGSEPGLHLHLYGSGLDRLSGRVHFADAADATPLPFGANAGARAPLVTPAELKARLRGPEELALLDVREEGRFADRGHLLFAAPAPLSRLELVIRRLVPRHDTPVVLTDEDEALAHRAALLLRRAGYTDIAVLAGGIGAWAAAGYELFTGVHVPSKAFGEIVEHEQGTPRLDAAEIHRLREAGQDLIIVDGRPYGEYQVMSIPGGIDCPNAELVLRVPEAVPSPETLVVVNCAGRTRSIIGAQTLINAGLPNRVVALRNGTMGWEIAGLPLEHGQSRTLPQPGPEGLARSRRAAAQLARRAGLRFIDRAALEGFRAEAARSLYVFDVRSPEEYLAGHLPGSRSAPGGQLVQETDRYAGTLRSRIVLVDDDGVRAPVTASWLVQLGWPEVYVLEGGLDGTLETGPEPLLVPGLAAARAPFVTPAALSGRIVAGQAFVIDIENSLAFRKAHVPGAWFTTRTRLAEAAARAPADADLVVTSRDGVLARLGAAELAAALGRPVHALLGGTEAWTAAGLPLEAGEASILADDDIWYPPHFRTRDREAGMHAYLQWELDLVAQIARDGDAHFRLLPPLETAGDCARAGAAPD